MPMERLRSMLKLSDALASGLCRNLAAEARHTIDEMPPEYVAGLFDEYEMKRLPEWSRQAISSRLALQRSDAFG